MGKRAWWLALPALVLVACSAQPQAGETSPTASAPTSCRLPVIAETQGQGSAPKQAGFVSLPGTVFSPDPGAAGGSFYSESLKRWVGARPPTLAPDGLSYAYFDGGTKAGNLEVADLKTGAFRLLATGGPWQVVGVGRDAVYVMEMEYVASPAYGLVGVSHGLWMVGLNGGVPVRLTSDDLYWSWVEGNTIYAAGSTRDVAGGPSPIVRFDVGAQTVATWFDGGARTRLLAVDAGGAGLALTEGTDEELWRIPATGEPVRIWSGPKDGIHPWGPVAVEGSDVWLSSLAATPQWAIYNYSPGEGLRQVATGADHPLTVAGTCA